MIQENKKDTAKIHAMISKACDETRGAIEGHEFKQYVLGVLFYRFMSESLTAYLNGYEYLSDEEAESNRSKIVSEKGFFIRPSELLKNICKKADEYTDLSDVLASIFKKIDNESGRALKGVFAAMDVNSNKLGATAEERNDRLNKLIKAINDLPLNFNDAYTDVLGDAYEYIIKMYSSQAGRSGGEFYTPPEVSELVAKIAVAGKTNINSAYDPTCGSGSLLLKLNKFSRVGSFYGQEINTPSHAICRVNMLLNGVHHNNFWIALGDTLTKPNKFTNEDGSQIKFNVIVSNPPYSLKWSGDAKPALVNDERFSPAGVIAPKSRADLAFIMHCMHSLEEDGTAVIVVGQGVLFRGGAEQKIREYLIKNNYVDAVIQLPANLFYSTTISTNILVLKKNRDTKEVMFIDASNQFIKEKGKNKLTPENINSVLDLYNNRKVVKNLSYLASYEELKTNQFDLAPASYRKIIADNKEIKSIKEIEQEALNRREKLKEIWNKFDKALFNAKQFLNSGDEYATKLINGKVNYLDNGIKELEKDTIPPTEEIRKAVFSSLLSKETTN